MFYAFVRTVVGFALRLFYRVRVDHYPDAGTGPVMFVANHPNAIIDPTLIFVITNRQVTFLAKAPLFKMPILGQLLKGLGALPVFRKQDNPALMAQNEGTFEAAAQALRRGGAITLFPEGKSHSESRMSELKTGAARIAFRAARDGAAVRIIPVGLTYAEKHRFRSEVLVDVTEPIEVKDYLPATPEDEQRQVRALTERIFAGLQRVTLNLEQWEDLPLIQTAEELLSFRLGDHAKDPDRLRRFARGVGLFRNEQPERFEAMRNEVIAFRRRLGLVRADTRDLSLQYQRGQVAWFAIRNLAAVLFGFPLFLLGGVLFALPFQIPRWANKALDVELDQQATIKFIGALVLAPLVMAGVFALTWWRLGPVWAVAALVASLPLAVFTRSFFERWRLVWRDVQIFFTLGNRTQLKARLLVEGERLAAEIDAAADEYRARVTDPPAAETKAG